jgi:hypothetical protein
MDVMNVMKAFPLAIKVLFQNLKGKLTEIFRFQVDLFAAHDSGSLEN